MTADRTVTLITNLAFVSVPVSHDPAGIQMHCHAIVIDDDLSSDRARSAGVQIRGFSTHASLPVFDMRAPSGKFSSATTVPAALIERGADPNQSIALSFNNGPLLVLTRTTMSDHAILIETFTNPDIGLVCDLLEIRAAQFWLSPRMPVALYMPATQQRLKLGSVSPIESNEARADFLKINEADRAQRNVGSKGSGHGS